MVVVAVAAVAVAAYWFARERRKRALVGIRPAVAAALESFAPASAAAL